MSASFGPFDVTGGEDADATDLNDSGVSGFTPVSANIKGMLVKYTLTGADIVAEEKISASGYANIAANGKLTLCDTSKEDYSDAATAKITAKGDGNVVLTITEVTQVVFDGSKFSALPKTLPDNMSAVTSITSVEATEDDAASESTTKKDITLVKKNGKWVNEEDVFLNITPAGTGSGSTLTISFLSAYAEYTGSNEELVTGTISNTTPVFVTLKAEKFEIKDLTATIYVEVAKTEG